MQRGLEQLAGFLEGEMLGINDKLSSIDRRLEQAQAVMLQHHDLHRVADERYRETHARLTALEGKVTAHKSPVLDLMREVMPLKHWAANAALAVLFLTGIISAEDIKGAARTYLLGSPPALHAAHATP